MLFGPDQLADRPSLLPLAARWPGTAFLVWTGHDLATHDPSRPWLRRVDHRLFRSRRICRCRRTPAVMADTPVAQDLPGLLGAKTYRAYADLIAPRLGGR